MNAPARPWGLPPVLCAAAGPLTLASFFLPWFAGSGIFSATELSGLRLLSFTESLQRLDLASSESLALWIARVGLAGIVAAATWLTVLALARPRSRLFRWSGWYVVAGAAITLAAGAALHGGTPQPGLWLWLAGAVCFFAAEACDRLLRPASSGTPIR